MATAGTQDRTSGRKTPKGPAVAMPASSITEAKPSGGRKLSAKATPNVKDAAPTDATIQMAVLCRATDMGLMGTEIHQVGARLPTKLLEQAKKRTGIASTTDLLAFALANVAVEDNFANAFVAARGRIDPDLDIGF
jgi:hypothetical protein